MIKESTEFKSFEEAEAKVKAQVINLCEQYTIAIKKILPTLKTASNTSKLSSNDTTIMSDLYNEGNDHLHNLVQLRLELDVENNQNDPMVLELSSEVLANTISFLKKLPDNLQKTKIME